MTLNLIPNEHCKYCGSQEITDYVFASRIKQGYNIAPTLDFGGMSVGDQLSFVPVSLNGIQYDNSEETAGAYKTRICKVCNNINISTDHDPLVVLTDKEEKALIPYMLYFVLKKQRYDIHKIEQLMMEFWTRDLRKIRDRWIKNYGVNPCSDHRLGFKTRLRLDTGIDLDVWVIVSAEGDDLVYRLSYGGNKTCR